MVNYKYGVKGGLYMNIIEHLLTTRNKLLKELSNCTNINQKPSNDSWSIAQVCHHLYLSEKTFTKAIKYGLSKKNDESAPLMNIQLILDRSNKVPAPEMVFPTEHSFEKEEIVKMLEESRKELLKLLNSLEDFSILRKKTVKHPIFGNLPLNQWVETIYLHEERHIAQIKEIREHVE